jgi:hypothetical protein
MTFNKPINIEASITQITLFTLFIPHETQVLHYNLQHGSQTQIVRRQRDILKVMAGHTTFQGAKKLFTLFNLKHTIKILHTSNNKILFGVYVVHKNQCIRNLSRSLAHDLKHF